MKLTLIFSALVLTSCSTYKKPVWDTYWIGCHAAVYRYILQRDNLTNDNLSDSLYAADYCKYLRERKEEYLGTN